MKQIASCLECGSNQEVDDDFFSGYQECIQCGSEKEFIINQPEDDNGLQLCADAINKSTVDDFVHLHVHSEYSLLDGFGHPEEYVTQAVANKQSAIALTDHGNTSGHFKWYKACKAQGIKPLLGCELYVTDSIQAHQRYWHLTVLAKDLVGLQNLYELVTISYRDGFYYKPRVDWELLQKHSKGLIATSGCSGSKIGWMINQGTFSDKEIITEIKRQQKIFNNNYYIELSPWEHPEGKQVAQKLHSFLPKLKIPVVITSDAHYPTKQSAKLHDVMLCIQTNATIDQPDRMKFSSDDYYICTGDEIRERWMRNYPDIPFDESWITNTSKIANSINFEFPVAHPIQFPFDGDKKKLLRKMVDAGMKRIGMSKSAEHKDRIKYELGLIEEKDFVDYFLVIADMVQWAKSNGIFVGCARGSSCGSLVCYALNITTIDPLRYGLLFERFIDINRTDLPDIDIDFEDDRRHEVKQYLERKYGSDRVASLSTFGTFKGRMCIQDIGRVFKIPVQVTDELKTLVIKRSGGDSRFGATIEDTFESFDKAKHILKKYPMLEHAKIMEGRVRHKGVHAAGVIVSNEPISKFASMYKDDEGNNVMALDYDDASEIGLLKIDVLGLTAMSVLKDCLAMVKSNHGVDIELNEIPLNDEKTLQSFRDLKLFGVFQFDGAALFSVTKMVQPDDFMELCAVNALSRPGTLHSGGTDSYIRRKRGEEKIDYLHPLLQKLTDKTYGIAIYQEQVMMVVREIGNFSWKDTSTIRKIMAKNVGAESFDKYRSNFVKGAAENKVDAKTAEAIWNKIYTFGSWAFNKSHCVAYTHIAYWMMYLKVHYPPEFYCAMLKKEADEQKQKRIVKEYINNGGAMLLPDPNISQVDLSIHQGKLLLGLGNIKGINQKKAQQIVANRPFKNVEHFLKVAGDATTKKFKEFGLLSSIGKDYQAELFELGDVESEEVKLERSKKLKMHCPLYPIESRLPKARQWFKDTFRLSPMTIAELDHIEGEQKVVVIGHTDPNQHFNPKNKVTEAMSSGKAFDTKGKNPSSFDYLVFSIEDDTAFINVRIPYSKYPKYKDMMFGINPTDYIAVKGSFKEGMLMVFAEEVINITQQYGKKKDAQA